MPFISSILGAIAHPVNVFSEYLAKLNRRQKCKAAILTHLDSWQKSKREQGKDDWVRIVVTELATQIGWHPETVHIHLHQLLEMGLVERKPANWHPGDRAYAYRICSGKVLEFLELDESHTRKSEYGTRNSDNHTRISECDTRISDNDTRNSEYGTRISDEDTRKTGLYLKYNLDILNKDSLSLPLSQIEEDRERVEVEESSQTATENRSEQPFTEPVVQPQDSQLQPIDSDLDEYSGSGRKFFPREASNLTENRGQLAIRYDSALGIRPPRQRPKFLYPAGPWLTENGCIDAGFLEDRAKLWRTGDTPQAKSFGQMSLEDVKGLVAGHYMNPKNHAKLEIDYAAYVAKNQRYLENVQTRMVNDVTIPETEVARIAQAIPVVTSEPIEAFSEYRNAPVVTQAPEVLQSLPQQTQQALPEQPQQRSAITVEATTCEPETKQEANSSEPNLTNSQQEEIQGLTPEELIENQRRLRQAIASRLKSVPKKPVTAIPERRRGWTSWTWEAATDAVKAGDKVLVLEAARWAEANGGEVVRDECGVVLEILPAF